MDNPIHRNPILTITLMWLMMLIIPTSFCQKRNDAPRHSIQQRFIIKNHIINKEKIEVSDTLQLDRLLKQVEKSWVHYVRDSLSRDATKEQLQGLLNMDAYSYMMTLIWKTGDSKINSDLEFHLVKRYMIPSLQTDLDLIKSTSDFKMLKYLWPGSLSNTLSIGSKYTREVTTANELYRILNELNYLLKSLNTSDQDIKAHAEKLFLLGKEFEYDILTKYYFFSKQPDLAFVAWVTGLTTNNYQKERAIEFSKDLINYFDSVGQKDKCLAILNTLTLYTNEDEIARDSLAAWYKKTAQEQGVSLFHMINRKISGERYVTVKERSLILPEKWNLIVNDIPDSKISTVKYFIIDFWYTGCAPCLQEIPDLNKLSDRLKNRDDIIFLSINTDYVNGKNSREFVKSISKKNSISFPVVYDDRSTFFHEQLKVSGYPAKFIIDNKGHLVTKVDNSPITLDTFQDFIKQNR